MIKIALLDDYARMALKSADWSVLDGKAELTVFDRHLSEDEGATLLKTFDVLCTIRERMSLPRSLFARLPNLKLVTIIGMSLPNLDMAGALCCLGYSDRAQLLFREALVQARQGAGFTLVLVLTAECELRQLLRDGQQGLQQAEAAMAYAVEKGALSQLGRIAMSRAPALTESGRSRRVSRWSIRRLR